MRRNSSWLVCDLTRQFNVPFAVSNEAQMQLLLQRRKLRCAAQGLVQGPKPGEKRAQLSGEHSDIDLATEPTGANPDLRRYPIIVVIFTGGCALIPQHFDFNALVLRLAEREFVTVHLTSVRGRGGDGSANATGNWNLIWRVSCSELLALWQGRKAAVTNKGINCGRDRV